MLELFPIEKGLDSRCDSIDGPRCQACAVRLVIEKRRAKDALTGGLISVLETEPSQVVGIEPPRSIGSHAEGASYVHASVGESDTVDIAFYTSPNRVPVARPDCVRLQSRNIAGKDATCCVEFPTNDDLFRI